MTRKKIFLLVVITLILSLTFLFFVLNFLKNKNYIVNSEDGVVENMINETSQDQDISKAEDLAVDNSKALKCISTSKSGDIVSTVYYDGKYRILSESLEKRPPVYLQLKDSGDFLPDKNVYVNSFINKEWQYEWRSVNKNGVKRLVNNTERSIDAYLKVGKSCSPWVVDENIFDRADKIRFIDLDVEKKSKKAIRCRWIAPSENYIQEYFFDGSNRVLSISQIRGENKKEYLLYIDGGWRYEWRSGEKIGGKKKRDASFYHMEEVREIAYRYSEYSCEDWNIDEDILSIPKDINFVPD